VTHRLKWGQSVKLDQFTTKGEDFVDDREAAEQEFQQLREELIELQYDLYAEGKRKLLVVLQAMDAGGKDGAIRHVFKGVNPQGVQVASFKAPSTIELDHDFLWRIHQRVPAAGMIGIFNRSHYEDVLVVRVEELVPEAVWRPRYDLINHFEKMLAETGTMILKFYLHISLGEQKERLQKRLDNPKKRWKFSHEDLVKRSQWHEYQTAYEEMLERCNTTYAPWYVIPADQKWYRNLAIARVLVETLRGMNLELPQAIGDLPAEIE
jgi:PPK2 family polyphosphate:nucleotide phosphotransferase